MFRTTQQQQQQQQQQQKQQKQQQNYSINANKEITTTKNNKKCYILCVFCMFFGRAALASGIERENKARKKHVF